jgi:hypothetical protein
MDSDTDDTTNKLLFDDVPKPDTELNDSSPYRERTANIQAALAHLTEEDIEQRIFTVVQVMHLLGLNLAVFLDQLLYKNKCIEENGVLVFERTTSLGSRELEDCLDRMHHRPISHESRAEQPKSNAQLTKIIQVLMLDAIYVHDFLSGHTASRVSHYVHHITYRRRWML